jgi:hypothetical protein
VGFPSREIRVRRALARRRTLQPEARCKYASKPKPFSCRTCGRDLEPDSARRDQHLPAPIETGFMDFCGLPDPPFDYPAPWRRR